MKKEELIKKLKEREQFYEKKYKEMLSEAHYSTAGMFDDFRAECNDIIKMIEKEF